MDPFPLPGTAEPQPQREKRRLTTAEIAEPAETKKSRREGWAALTICARREEIERESNREDQGSNPIR
jgi:hypothetical protein